MTSKLINFLQVDLHFEKGKRKEMIVSSICCINMFYALLKNIHYFVAYQITVFLQLKLRHNHQHLNNVDKFSTASTFFSQFTKMCSCRQNQS